MHIYIKQFILWFKVLFTIFSQGLSHYKVENAIFRQYFPDIIFNIMEKL